MKYICLVVICSLSAVSFGQNLSASEFDTTPAFVETFAGGNSVGQ